jgi:hypothetical protein
VSRESKIAVLESILVRVQCRANEPRAPRLAAVAEASARAEVAAEPAIEPVVAPVMRAPLVREERESLPPWPDPEPETGPQLIPIDDAAPQLIPIDDSAPQLIPIDEPPPSSPRLRDETDAEPMAGAADASEEADERITLPPVSGRQHVEGVSPERVVTLAPESEPPLPALDMDISAGGESATPPPAAPLALVPAPIEMVESAEPPAVQAEAPSVRLMVEPGPRAPGRAPPAPVAVEVRADAIVPPERAAARVAIFEGEAKRFAPKSIGELLDATLGLGR